MKESLDKVMERFGYADRCSQGDVRGLGGWGDEWRLTRAEYADARVSPLLTPELPRIPPVAAAVSRSGGPESVRKAPNGIWRDLR